MDNKNKFLMVLSLLAVILPCRIGAQITHQCDFRGQSFSHQDTIIQGMTYRAYYAPGLDLTSVPRCPQLPLKLLRFSVPYNATNITVQVTGGTSNTSPPQSISMLPVADMHLLCDSLPMQIIPDGAVYNTNAFYPTVTAEVLGEGVFLGENRIVTVAAYPLQFNPVTRRLRINNTISFTVQYTLDPNLPTDLTLRGDTTLRRQGWNQTKALVVNPSQVETFAPEEPEYSQIQSMALPDSLLSHLNDSTAVNGGVQSVLDRSPKEYLIVTTRDLKSSFRRLAALKRQKGYGVGICCIEDIVADPFMQCGDSLPDATCPIKDDAGKLRQYLRTVYKLNGTRFVLLGGKSIPFRYCHIGNNPKPTDHYYSDLTTNWKKSSNYQYGDTSQYGDFYKGFDINPELFVGRLEALEEGQIANYTRKLLTYELNPGNGAGSYLNRMFINKGFKESHFSFLPLMYPICDLVFQDVHVMSQLDNSYPTGRDVIQMINANQYGFLAIFGHGHYNCIKVNNAYDSTGSFIMNLHKNLNYPHSMGLDSLRNKYYPSVCYALSCSTIPFDTTRYNMGQSFTLGKDYGGVAYIGFTSEAYAYAVDSLGYAMRLEKKFFETLNKGIFKSGAAQAYSKVKNREGRKYYLDEITNNLIGDPEFDIWTNAPISYASVSINRNNSSVQVAGVNFGDTIAYCSNTDQGRMVATGNSVTLDNVNPNSSIMVYHHNKLPYIAPLVLQNTTIGWSQYVIASDVVAGSNVDSGRTAGNVTIKKGVDYEIECKGSVTLKPGFTVEKGATFSVKASDY